VTLSRRLAAETLGSLSLGAAVIGSGIMADRLAAGNAAIALLANTTATVAALGVLITVLTSSTSFANPAITVARALSDTFAGIRPDDVPAFVAAQLAGALLAWRCAAWLLARGSDAPEQD
jgi:glycerol uptake facilitator-like aquaporin